MRFSLTLLLLLMIAVAPVSAQRYEELAQVYSQPAVYHEAFALPVAGRSAVVVSFRIPNRLLVFVRNRQEVPGRAFLAEPRMMVELYRAGQRVDIKAWQRTHYAATFEETQQNDRDVQGMIRFDMPPDVYTYRLRFKDQHAERENVTEPKAVSVPDFEKETVGTAVLARHVYSGQRDLRIDLINLNGNIAYGQDAWAVVPVTLPDDQHIEDTTLRYTLRRLNTDKPDATEGVLVREDTSAGDTWIQVSGRKKARLGEGTLHWPKAGFSEDSPAGYLVPIDLHGATLADGAYLLETTLDLGTTSRTVPTRFSTYWRGMPYSLYDPEVAIRNLRFVEDRQALKALHRGSRKEKEQRIRAYWKERDPTPETPYNELMAEYYRRVDEAAFAYRTGLVAAPDGLQTDRAPVFIVYGAPQSIERTFPPGGGVQETWIYTGGRLFVFWAATSLDPLRLQQAPSR